MGEKGNKDHKSYVTLNIFCFPEAPEELFDYESQEICGSEYMKKFGCAHDAVASVFCKDTCMNVIGQLMHHSPVMSMLQMGVLGEN